MRKLSKKGFILTEVPQLVIILLVIAIVMGIGATVLTQIQGTQATGSSAYNVTQDGLEAQADLSGWQTTWVVIVAAAVILGVIYQYLFFG
jgi:uncharacterized protein YceK